MALVALYRPGPMDSIPTYIARKNGKEAVEYLHPAMEPILKENIIGVADVKKLFELSKGGVVAGCVISSGRIVRGKVRVTRRKNVIF